MRTLLLLLLPLLAFCETIETFYGELEVNEPVLLELIKSEPVQRLKNIHQYGVSYYASDHNEEYTRFDHSMGVFAILRIKNRPLLEQISGLLHDVSHTIFSHVGDWIFDKEHQEKDYQNSIHKQFLRQSGIAAILAKHGISLDKVEPTFENFPALEQPLPNLCADRIDYNIQGAYLKNFITKVEALDLLSDLKFTDGQWIGTNPELMAKIVRFSMFMTKNTWGCPDNHTASRCLADAILRAREIGLITHDEIHFGTDDSVWNKLKRSADPFITQRMGLLTKVNSLFQIVDHEEADTIYVGRFRGINPLINKEGKVVRLTEIDQKLREEFIADRNMVNQGWALKHMAEFPQPSDKERILKDTPVL
ncbi:MAG: HD domain-containing protein [Simkaniaceae bacterium]|nr:HD domain-containing protein [Simkaniaceae bacterium]